MRQEQVPPDRPSRTQPFPMRFDVDMLEWIDRKRGRLARSVFVREIILKAMRQDEENGRDSR